MQSHELDVTLEKLMDEWGTTKLLNSLARVCREKADYVRGGGSHGEPSAYLGQCWESTAKHLDKAADKAVGL